MFTQKFWDSSDKKLSPKQEKKVLYKPHAIFADIESSIGYIGCILC